MHIDTSRVINTVGFWKDCVIDHRCRLFTYHRDFSLLFYCRKSFTKAFCPFKHVCMCIFKLFLGASTIEPICLRFGCDKIRFSPISKAFQFFTTTSQTTMSLKKLSHLSNIEAINNLWQDAPNAKSFGVFLSRILLNQIEHFVFNF